MAVTRHAGAEPRVELGAGFAALGDLPLREVGPHRPLSRRGAGALQVADHFIRGERALGRFSHVPAVLGVAVAPRHEPCTVQVRIAFDDTSEAWWRERVAGLGTAGQRRLERDPVTDGLEADWYEAAADRLVRLQVPGVAARHVLLGRRGPNPPRRVTGVATFRLPAGYLADGGVLLIRVLDADRGVREQLGAARASAVGLELLDIRVDEPREPSTIRPGSVTIDAGTAETAGYLAPGGSARGFGAGLRRVGAAAVLLPVPRPVGFDGLVLTSSYADGASYSLADEHDGLATVSLATGRPLEDAPLEEHARGVLVHPPTEGCALLVPDADARGRPLKVLVRGLVVEPGSPLQLPAEAPEPQQEPYSFRHMMRMAYDSLRSS